MTNLDSVLKSRHYFAYKGPSSQGHGFSSSHVWMWELDLLKKAECRRTDAFKLWCWRRLLRVPWTARRSSQSILKEISPEYSLDAEAILWPPDVKSWFIWKDPDAGKDWRREQKRTTEGWTGWMASQTQWTWVWVSSGSWWWTGRPGGLQSMVSQRVRHNWAAELQGLKSWFHLIEDKKWSLIKHSFHQSLI